MGVPVSNYRKDNLSNSGKPLWKRGNPEPNPPVGGKCVETRWQGRIKCATRYSPDYKSTSWWSDESRS